MKGLLPVKKTMPNRVWSTSQPSRAPVLQPKLTVNQPGDAYEQEADEVAEEVMRMTRGDGPPTSTAGGVPGELQRKCAQCEEEEQVQRKCSNCEEEEKLQRSESDCGVPNVTPAVHEALGSSGQPLDRSTRSFMEERFGHDFGSVRVHSDPVASRSARDINALAYTHHNNIVFGEGHYRPGSNDGRKLLAHELAHVVQQNGKGGSLSRTAIIQRACLPAICPLASIPIPSVPPLPYEAEKCLQGLYKNTHPGNTISFNRDWVNLTGKGPESKALRCLRGEGKDTGYNFSAKSGMYAGEPDIWDFSSRTMYEITTLSGMAFRVGKLAAEIALANDIAGTADCGGNMYSPGDWTPARSCFLMESGLYLEFVQNNRGVLVYQILKDATAELAFAVLLATLAAMAKNGLGKGLVAAGAKQIGGKLIPAYAVASLAAMAVLLASGKAHAKLGPGTDEPIAQLFKAMEQSGTPVPKELQDFINNDPELRDKLNADIKKGDLSAAQKKVNDRIWKIVNDNKDQFTKEELEQILAPTELAGSALPDGNITVAEIKKLIAVKDGKAGGSSKDPNAKGTGGGKGSGGAKDSKSPKTADANKSADPKPPADAKGPTDAKSPTDAKGPIDANEAKGANGADGTGKGSGDKIEAGKGDGSAKDRNPDVKYPKLSPESKQKISAASPAVKDLWDVYVTEAGQKTDLAVTDDLVKRFFDIVPSSLSAEQAQTIISRLQQVPDTKIDQVFESLQKGIKDVQAPSGSGTGAKVQSAPASQPVESREQVIKRLKDRAAKTNFGDLSRGDYLINWGQEQLVINTTFSASLRGKTSASVGYVGDIVLEVVSIDKMRNTFVARFVSTTPFVTKTGAVLFDANGFTANQTITLISK